ncbi:hypothetical protein [Marinobacterium stanieri]|uniref:Uncharacterized protein n=1 Tax=Marinobacterium stanieri TaxID=49186 RepID=A0A1N6X9T9_9GAMM|nr:hypothetical protein [Marinobacterium stanieri]SIQ99096.1 hypothetical protein SAMN05421647_11337 [Marinobacterium stanieri]
MLKRTEVTLNGSNIHISHQNSTIVFASTEGFTFDEAAIVTTQGSQRLPCSQNDYKRIVKQYHKAIRPQRKPYLLWTGCITVVCLWAVAVVPFNGDQLLAQQQSTAPIGLDNSSNGVHAPRHTQGNSDQAFPFASN